MSAKRMLGGRYCPPMLPVSHRTRIAVNAEMLRLFRNLFPPFGQATVSIFSGPHTAAGQTVRGESRVRDGRREELLYFEATRVRYEAGGRGGAS